MVDPLQLSKLLWPHVVFYKEQEQIIYSVEENDQTYVPAGNMLGKDFVAGFIGLSYFLRCRKAGYTCRIITTSVKDDHLRVLWGEIGRFIQSSKYPLTCDKGGPLLYNHRDIRWQWQGKRCEISYLRGMVSERGEGLAGHHAGKTLVIVDEASGADDLVFTQTETWARKGLYIGNPNPTENLWRKCIEQGDLLAN